MRTKFQRPSGQARLHWFYLASLASLAAWLPACVPCNNFGKPYGLIYGFGINFSSGFDLPNITQYTKNKLGSH